MDIDYLIIDNVVIDVDADEEVGKLVDGKIKSDQDLPPFSEFTYKCRYWKADVYEHRVVI